MLLLPVGQMSDAWETSKKLFRKSGSIGWKSIFTHLTEDAASFGDALPHITFRRCISVMLRTATTHVSIFDDIYF